MWDLRELYALHCVCQEIICWIQRNIAAGELAVQWRYEIMLMEISKGYDLRRLTLGINLNLFGNLWKLWTWINWVILLRFFQLEIAEDIWGELSISILPTKPNKTHQYLKWNVLFVNHHTVILCLNGSWFDSIVCHSSCFEGWRVAGVYGNADVHLWWWQKC